MYSRFSISKLFILIVLALGFLNPSFAHALPQTATFSLIELYPNIETIGVVINGLNLPKTAELRYRQSNETNWRTGHPLMQIDDGRLIGSLFGLAPATVYEVKVINGAEEISGTTSTQANELIFTPLSIIYVNDDAPAGGNGSINAPFQKIQDGVNSATAGTQVLVADGVYHETVTFPSSGSPNNWIQVKAQGNAAILDGSFTPDASAWEQVNDRKILWVTKLGMPIKYLARSQKRFYNYDDLKKLNDGEGHNKTKIDEGWFIEPYTWKLYVRSSENPANSSWQIPNLSHAFKVENRDWIWIEGFEMRHYGVNESCGVCATNSSHIVIRKNKIHNLQLGIFINWNGSDVQGNDTRIEYNEIYDPMVNEWEWNAVKGTSMEGTAIVLRGHIGAIVRENNIHNFFNGIYTGSSAALENPSVAFDADIYNNRIYQISDDALEPEGASINQRFRNNTIDSSFVGISLAPITKGPTWVLRSTFANYTGKAVKWDLNSDGIVLMYHNTSWTSAPNAVGMEFISPIRNSILRNNIFSGAGLGIQESLTGAAGNDWNNNNWYTTRSIPHFKWENILYNSTNDLCAAYRLECQGYEDIPGLTSPGAGNFTLLGSSPNVDRGALIPGINDGFSGNAPDIGSFELVVDSPPKVLSSARADATPTNANSVGFTVTFSEPVQGVSADDFALYNDPSISGAAIANVTPISTSSYLVTINTGSGNGMLRLDVANNQSIMDLAGNVLSSGFNSGESYTIVKDVPIVLNIKRAEANPTTADLLRYTVTFSKEMSGVDAGDFTLTKTGAIAGASITELAGSGAIYTVTVNNGTGSGTIRLDLLDNDSIVDMTNNPLGGVGIGNANYSTGEEYTINEIVPFVLKITRVDADPASGDSIRFLVTFSEAVGGVDAGDFIFTTSGGVAGTSISIVDSGGSAYLVTLGVGSGNGTVRLDLMDNDSILNAQGQPLGGTGAGNGSFTTGETYTINKPVRSVIRETFISNRTYDGWVLEGGEKSNKGWTKDASSATFNVGDDAKNRQYRAILHFSTSTLPDNAIISMALLMIKKQGAQGSNPFETHQNIQVDIRRGAFGNYDLLGSNTLQISDFQYPASLDSAGIIQNNPVGDWYWSSFMPASFSQVNLSGSTQLRLEFQLDDNNDFDNDYLKFFSSNYGVETDRPQLVIEYSLP